MHWILALIFLLTFQAQGKTHVKSAELPAKHSLTSIDVASNELSTPVLEGNPVEAATDEVGTSTTAGSAAAAPSNAMATQESTKNLKEDQIMVNLETTKKANASENPLLRVFFSICIVGILGFGAFFLIRKYRYGNPKTQATQIKVLSQHFLGPKKSLAIIRVAGESILVGITDHNISMIKSLSLLDEDIPEETPKEFHSVFNLSRNKQDTDDQAKQDAKNEKDAESREDFSISGIKDFVSLKMKNMRTLE